MKIFKILLISFSLWFGTAFWANAQENVLSLAAAHALASQQSLERQVADTRAQTAALDLAILQTQLRPRLQLNANLPSFFETSRGVTQPNGSIAFQNISQNNAQLGLNLSQAIARTNTSLFLQTNLIRFDDFTADLTNYNGVPLRFGIRQGINEFNALKWDRRILPLVASAEKQRARTDIARHLVTVTEHYFALLRAQVNQQIATSNIESNEKIVQIAEERYTLGKISQAELLQIQLNNTSSQQALMAARRQTLAQGFALKQALNGFADSLIVAPPVELPQTDIPVERAVTLAWENHPNQQELAIAALRAEEALDRAKKENGLQAALQASIGLTKNAGSLEGVYQSPKAETLIDLQLTVPLYQGGQGRKAKEQALLQQQLVAQQRAFTEASFAENVRQLVLQTNTLRQEVGLSQERYRIAQQRYGIANERFALGNISITDLTIAFGERDLAWRNYINTLSDFWVNHQLVEALTGNEW